MKLYQLKNIALFNLTVKIPRIYKKAITERHKNPPKFDYILHFNPHIIPKRSQRCCVWLD